MYFFKYQPDVKLFLQLCLIDTQNRIKHVTFVDLICTQSKFSFKGTVHSKIFGQQSSISQIIKVYSCSTCKFCSNDEYCVCVCVCVCVCIFLLEFSRRSTLFHPGSGDALDSLLSEE